MNATTEGGDDEAAHASAEEPTPQVDESPPSLLASLLPHFSSPLDTPSDAGVVDRLELSEQSDSCSSDVQCSNLLSPLRMMTGPK